MVKLEVPIGSVKLADLHESRAGLPEGLGGAEQESMTTHPQQDSQANHPPTAWRFQNHGGSMTLRVVQRVVGLGAIGLSERP